MPAGTQSKQDIYYEVYYVKSITIMKLSDIFTLAKKVDRTDF